MERRLGTATPWPRGIPAVGETVTLLDITGLLRLRARLDGSGDSSALLREADEDEGVDVRATGCFPRAFAESAGGLAIASSCADGLPLGTMIVVSADSSECTSGPFGNDEDGVPDKSRVRGSLLRDSDFLDDTDSCLGKGWAGSESALTFGVLDGPS